MHDTKHGWIFPLLGAMALAACSPKTPTVAPAPAPVAAPQAQPVQAASPLLGQWNGPEGTSLRIDGAGGKYAITVRNLDGPRTFQGRDEGGTLHFERDGKALTIRPGDGKATGMKWLVDKHHCVVIEAGEGYCRD